MANLYLCPDDFWRCPIDLNHRVLAKRFQYHIRRCMIANPHIHRVRCVFNANHLTTPSELLAHMSTCPDAINTSMVLIGLSDIPPGRPWSDNCHRSSIPTDRQMFHDVTATEDWDDDIYQRRAKSTGINEQTFTSSSIISPVLSPRGAQYLNGKQQENIEHYAYELDHVEDANPKTSYNPATVAKQAHVLKQHSNDGQIHPVEADEISKRLMKIRTLQLIGGAGRGACCLLHTAPPVPGLSSHK